MSKYTAQGQLNSLANEIMGWRIKKGFETDWDIVPEKLMLVVTELAEAMEAYRKIPQDAVEKLKQADEFDKTSYPKIADALCNFKEELADTLIRLLDLTSALNIDIEWEVEMKMIKNEARPRKHGKQR